jgi:hypothetical protein
MRALAQRACETLSLFKFCDCCTASVLWRAFYGRHAVRIRIFRFRLPSENVRQPVQQLPEETLEPSLLLHRVFFLSGLERPPTTNH